MRSLLTSLLIVAVAGSASARGLLIPADQTLPPLAMVNHRVQISIEDQVSITTIEQSFRNHTDRNLEATYLFPLPKGASVNKFTMWIDGKESSGELLDAKKAADVYTTIVRRTQDPGLLEYVGNNLMRLRVFPVLPKADQKVKISYTSIAQQDQNLVEYIYPLRTEGKAVKTLDEFSIDATLKSQHPIQNVYSPTHAVNIQRMSDKEVRVKFDRNQAALDKDFMLFYSLGNREIGITPLFHRPITGDDGYVLLLISPELEESKSKILPRDMVLVMDTSGSMDAVKMDQARKAVKYCLSNLNPKDRFGVLGFSTNVRKYRDGLADANDEQIDAAKKWVDGLRAGGGTAIQSALDSALEMRTKETGRSFTIVFFTDGQPTIGEMKPENILKSVAAKNNADTRIFTFGVGDDVNTALLDQLADGTRAVSTYVRPSEDIEQKVTSLHNKISHPVLANVRLTVSENVKLFETYPAKLPDLFHGGQLVVLAKYSGNGAAAVKLTGQVGSETKEFAYDVQFPARAAGDREFVEHLWARRKVGFLLDQVRLNGEQKELMEEMMTLAKKYGIATPYTSHLIVPDAPMPSPVVRPLPGDGGGFKGGPVPMPVGLAPAAPGAKAEAVEAYARRVQAEPAKDAGKNRDETLAKVQKQLEDAKKGDKAADLKDLDRALDSVKEARGNIRSNEQARQWLEQRDMKNVQGGNSVAVDLAVTANNLRMQDRLVPTANRNIQGRNCLDVGGVWIDAGFDAKMKSVTIKAQSEAYFKLLEKNPDLKDVFRLGNHLVFVLPNNTALIVDAQAGKETLTDAEVAAILAK